MTEHVLKIMTEHVVCVCVFGGLGGGGWVILNMEWMMEFSVVDQRVL